MSIRRIGLGVFAQGYSQAVTVLLQLMTAPWLIAAWGGSQYGAWIVLSALPTYLLLADFGFGQVAGNDMSMRMTRGDIVGARAIFESLIGLFLLVIVPLLSLCALAALFLPIDSLLPDFDSPSNVRQTLLLVVAASGVSIFGGVISAALRAEGLFSLMVLTTTTGRLVEGLGVVAGASFFRSGIEGAAAITLGLRVASIAFLIVVMLWRSNVFRVNLSHADPKEIRRLTLPSVLYLGFSVGYALCLQGVIIAIGAFLGPTSVTIYATSRTLARLGVNSLSAVNYVFQYEYAASSEDRAAFLRTERLHFALEGLGLLSFAAILGLFGPKLYALWLGGRVVFLGDVFLIIVLQSIAEAIWAAAQTPLIATNNHSKVALQFVVGSVVSTAIIISQLRHSGSLVNVASVLMVMFAILAAITVLQLRAFWATFTAKAGLDVSARAVIPADGGSAGTVRLE